MPRAFATAALALATTAPLLVGVGSPAGADSSDRPSRTKTSAAWSATSVVAGTPVTVSGRVKDRVKGTRKVVLQQKIASGWIKVDGTRTTSSGDYVMAVPTGWFYSSKLRVLAKRTRKAGGDISKATRVTVVPAWAPQGDPKAWRHITRYQVRLNPCRTVTYRVNAAQGLPDPATALTAAHAAVDDIAQATGLTFKYLGTTDAMFQGSGKSIPKDTDLLISWQRDDQTKLDIGPSYGARGGAGKVIWGRNAQGKRIGLALNTGIAADSQEQGMTYTSMTQLLMHELQHAVGLHHVNDPYQYMNPSQSIYTLPLGQWGAGDLTGLRKVGLQAGCVRRW
ncbi:hypothetical protein DDE18_10790 [Nocardioides gansuensis]|uniref:Peptidase M10 metallopeptidase domain-containing protein n=1 Tax=Nocardioides gansuensis TaxID=2138300 RepID=A0A2T8FAT6_9ACTN|nr:hypothetical protein [Nocardioides gansuensis]PVG82836.1 hypothetical protein DDE18_10790 [Nocardioides gansuensis]